MRAASSAMRGRLEPRTVIALGIALRIALGAPVVPSATAVVVGVARVCLLGRVRTGVHVGKERGGSVSRRPEGGSVVVSGRGGCWMGGAIGLGWAGGGAANTLVVVGAVAATGPRANRDWPLCGDDDDDNGKAQ